MKKLMVLACTLFAAVAGMAQEKQGTELQELVKRTDALEEKVKKMGQLKISGYIQAQWQWAETPGMKNSFGGGDFGADMRNRLSVRRGRVKFDYTNQFGKAVMQIDATEKGLSIKDVYLQFTEPKFKALSLTAGVFDRPFGYEISYSSSRRETPERSRLFQTLFPGERELGAKLTLAGPSGTAWSGLKAEGGLFAGNGVAAESDSKKDFIGRISYTADASKSINYGVGASLYSGGVRQATTKKFEIKDGAFIENDSESNKGDYAKREYYGFDAQFLLKTVIGVTNLRAEYVWGQQPGTLTANTSPKAARTEDTYLRDFQGYYIYFVQDIAKTKFSAVAKYDYYDPNSKVSSNQINPANGFSEKGADIAYSTFGVGLLYNANSNIRIMAYYDIVSNEKTDKITDFSTNIKDNLFTLRLQYKF